MVTDDTVRAAETKASGSSFYKAMRLLPKERRNAMYAIYAFCRAVDDIADDATRSRSARLRDLEAWRSHIDALYSGRPSTAATFLAGPMSAFALRKEDFLAIIDGMEMDVVENICAPPLATLDLYCDRVASAVGRLSIKIFGMDERPGFALAHHLGRALQLTNILRDLDEDAGLGRLYLPREFLDEASLVADDPRRAIDSNQIDSVCRTVAGLARNHYLEAQVIFRQRPRGDLRPPRLMSAVYSSLLRRMESQGWFPPRRRARIATSKLLWFGIRHGLFPW